MPDTSAENPKTQNLNLFNKYDQKVVLGENGGIEYAVTNLLPEEQSDRVFHEVVENGFAAVNNDTGVQQNMTIDEFKADARSRGVLKFTADSNGKTVAVLTVHVGIDQVSWIDKDSVMTLQDQIDKYAPPLYIGTIVVDPNFKGIDRIGTKLASYALNEQVNLLINQGAKSAVFFDCIWRNVPGVPALVQMAINQIPGGREKLKLMEWCVDNGVLTLKDFEARTKDLVKDGYRYFAVVPS